MTTEYRFIEPVDILMLRGNQLFGEPGSYGESLIPPWPSVAAGAIRSRMLVDDNVDLDTFKRSEAPHPTLGTPAEPGSFTLTGFHLAREHKGQTERLMPPPADLVISRDEKNNLVVRRLTPQPISLPHSGSLPLLPVLQQKERSKPEGGYWLTQSGWQACLAGRTPTPTPEHLVPASELWQRESRVGIGLDGQTGSVETGKLFTTQAISLGEGVGFLVAVDGAEPPASGLLRLGGDGRGAHITTATVTPAEPDYKAIAEAGRCRVILTSPAIFEHGWRPTGTGDDGRFKLHGVTGRLAAASVARTEVVSGWDLARHRPKTAQRTAPAGSVYWLDELEASPDALRKLAEAGLWPDHPDTEQLQRRAEGFNRLSLAAW